jgi:hypothetical protein
MVHARIFTYLTISFLMFSFVDVFSQTKSQEAIFKFEKEWYDFGKIGKGEKVFYNFKFKNIGMSPLIISDVDAGCSCTVPEWPKTPIMPNSSANIKVSYSSKDHNGIFNKAIRISSNSSTPTKIIRIKGIVK